MGISGYITPLMNMYINQHIQVKWNNAISKQSNIKNEVRQGGCLSPSLFSVHLNKLIEILRKLISASDVNKVQRISKLNLMEL